MALKVPINPETRVPSGQLGYARAVDVSSGTRALGQVVREYGLEVQREDKKRELFDVQRMVVDETNALQSDFETRKSSAPLGADGFTQTVNSEYNARHDAMVQGLRERGYSEDAVQEFGTRLGGIRSQYVASAIDFQDKSRFAKAGVDTRDFSISLGHYVETNPLAVRSALTELKTSLANREDLDEIERAQLYEDGKKIIMDEARFGYTKLHPDDVIRRFDPGEAVVPAGNVEVAEGQEFDLQDYFKRVRPAEGTGKNKRSSASGHFQFTRGTWLETYKQVFGNTNETDDQILAKRKDAFTATKLAEKFTGDNIQNLVAAGKPVNNTTVYMSHFLGSADAIKVLSAHADATITALVDPRSIAANPEVFAKVKTAGDMVHWAGATMGVSEQPSGTVVKTPAPSAQPVLSAVLADEHGVTGIDVLDLSTGPERLQMLAWAKSFSSENTANERAGLEVNHQNAVNAYLTTGGYSGAKPTVVDYNRIYGPVIGGQKYAELENAERVGRSIQQFKSLPAVAIESQVEALRPKNTASATYTEELQSYTTARTAADNILKSREDNPSGYVFSTFPEVATRLQNAKNPEERRFAYKVIDEVYKRLGIAPDKRYIVTDEQAKELQDNYYGMSPGQKIRQLQEWNTELGALHNPFMRQMTNEGYGAGADSVMWSMLSKHPQGFSTMSQILAGQQIIKEDPARKPGADVVNSNFKDTLGASLAMLNPAASKIYNDAAASIYVANGGRTDNEQFDPDLYAKSLRLAVGGLPNNPNSGIVNLTQGKVKDWTILPQRTTQLEFTNWVDRLTPGVLTRLSVEKTQPLYRTGNPAPLQDIVDEGVFVAVAPNHYIIKMASDGNPLKTASGNNFVVRLNPGEPKNVPPIRSRTTSAQERALNIARNK